MNPALCCSSRFVTETAPNDVYDIAYLIKTNELTDEDRRSILEKLIEKCRARGIEPCQRCAGFARSWIAPLGLGRLRRLELAGAGLSE